ncbi:MAG: N,N-dimethylformamidase beta subunit family domain-containing protein [Microvirga sp.]
MIDTTAVLGYAVPLGAAPGERVAFHLSSETLSEATLEVVRIRCADPDPAGPGLKLFAPGSSLDGKVKLSHQMTHPGSCAIVPDDPVFKTIFDLSVGCFLFPTLIEGVAQTILSRWSDSAQAGWKLSLDGEGHLEMTVACDGAAWTARTTRPLQIREWAFVGGVLDLAAGRLRVFQISMETQGGRDRSSSAEVAGPKSVSWPEGVPVVIAAHATAAMAPARKTAGHFTGKIDRPRLYAGALAAGDLRALVENLTPQPTDPKLIAAWDFSEGIETETIADRSANRLSGSLHHLPVRAVTGANWDGRTHAWTEAPWQYGAIHFHDDDVADAGWKPDLEFDIPQDWRSGFYALKLTARTSDDRPVESYVPFFVRAPRCGPIAPIAVVAPTATYLAYANSALRLDQVHVEAQFEGLVVLSNDDLYLSEHRELGMSTYDMHRDGSGSCYSSGARPIINMRPRGNTFNFVNDTHLLDWLEEMGFAYDVITDEDIHHEGARALQPYQVAITMTHPEYFSRQMLETFDAYQGAGGRHMYLGGNGFYWRIAFHPTRPNTIEIRRGFTGTRTWEGEAGENNLSFTGEPSGLWRSNGRPPQRLVGVGFDAQVFDRSWPYLRQPGGQDPRVSFVFEGIGENEVIGDFGLRLGGAAGLEIDRVDETLGSPPNIITLASAECPSPGALPTSEDFYITHRGLTGDQNARVRADIVFFPTKAGGAVFSTGSIAWCCSLSHNGYDNNVSRINENVLRRFLDPAPFEGFDD